MNDTDTLANNHAPLRGGALSSKRRAPTYELQHHHHHHHHHHHDDNESLDSLSSDSNSLDASSLEHSNLSLIETYAKLPPPSIPLHPFTFLEHDVDQLDLTSREDFGLLKAALESYVDELHHMLNPFETVSEHDTVYASSMHNHHSQHLEAANIDLDDEEKEQPTTIQLLKALEKANRIVAEVDRSHLISNLKAMKQSD